MLAHARHDHGRGEGRDRREEVGGGSSGGLDEEGVHEDHGCHGFDDGDSAGFGWRVNEEGRVEGEVHGWEAREAEASAIASHTELSKKRRGKGKTDRGTTQGSCRPLASRTPAVPSYLAVA
jgi:hypothetical protein